MPDDRFPSAALHAMALVASLRTALGVSTAIAARRAGHDASAQEPEASVRAYLVDALDHIGSLVVRLRLRTLTGEPDDEQAALVVAFEDRLLLADLAEELRVVHQKLLSLYPAVAEDVIEAIRLYQREAQALTEVLDLALVAAPFAERLADTLDDLHIALGIVR